MPIKINPILITIFVACSIVEIYYPKEVIEVLPFILCAIFAGLIYYLEKPLIKRLTFFLYLALSFYEPEYILFIPVIFYAFVEESQIAWTTAVLLPFLYHIHLILSFSSEAYLSNKLLIAFVMTLFAFLLKYQENAKNELREQLIQKTDAMRALDLHLNEKNQELMAHQDDQIHYATLKERNRIAREIHDHVGHQLSRVLLQIGAQLTLKPSDPSLLSMKDTLDSAMDNLRKSVHDLHDTAIELETQLRQVTSGFEKCPIHMTLHIEAEPPAKTKVAFVAILKESLSNITKHSDATQVNVSLIEHPHFYQFIISDNGTASRTKEQEELQSQGIGLKNIEQRITELKGRFLIRTQNGFELFITLPKNERSQS